MKVAVLLSGGVDSSVALKLLQEEGHDLTAFYLKVWMEDELSFKGDCPWKEDLSYAQKVCRKLNIPLKIIPVQKEYWDKVVSYVVEEAKKGRTPSPDLFCNKRIKFGVFFDKIGDEFQKIATGHYARIEKRGDIFYLKRAKDSFKDQTYFLSHLSQDQLSRLIFPLGNFLKSEVRSLAKKYGLPTYDRKDSQGICFLGKVEYSDFIASYLGEKEGDLIEIESGQKVGKHKGVWFYTIGQRRGIGLSGGPWYVVSKDVKNNIVYISKNYFSADKKRNSFWVSNFNWLCDKRPLNENLQVKIRHGKEFYNATIEFEKTDKGFVKIDKRDQGIAAGQFAVFYDGDICLGCGVIT